MKRRVYLKENPGSEILVTFDNTDILDQTGGSELFQRIRPYINQERNIIIDLGQVKTINSDGFGFLKEIMNLSAFKGCSIYFSNISDEIEDLIDSLTITNEG
jgi:ABC-type transporter Mla MlaB component